MSDENTDKPAMPLVRRFESKIARIATRITKAVDYSDRFDDDELKESFDAAAKALRVASKILAGLPDDAGRKIAAKGEGKRTAFQVGSFVDIKERVRGSYEDLLDDDDLVGLEVVKVAKGKVGVTTTGGVRMFIPKAHLTASEEE